jgi:small subunit ribosomal protein S1
MYNYHQSNFSNQYTKTEIKKKGDKIKVQIDEILFEQHKISMGLPVDAEDSSWRTHAAAQPAKKSGFNTSLQGLNDLLKKK